MIVQPVIKLKPIELSQANHKSATYISSALTVVLADRRRAFNSPCEQRKFRIPTFPKSLNRAGRHI